MILVLLGTQNNSFHRLLEEVEKNIENGNIQEEVVVQAGFTKFESDEMKIFDMISTDEFEKLIQEADLIITHGGVGSMVAGIRAGKRVIAVPRQKKYGEHVNDHQKEIIDTFRRQGVIIGIDEVEELSDALKKAKELTIEVQEQKENNIVTIVANFIDEDSEKRKNKRHFFKINRKERKNG
jgi:UDP-N-acetylglucosamine transferase subunit ALG13